MQSKVHDLINFCSLPQFFYKLLAYYLKLNNIYIQEKKFFAKEKKLKLFSYYNLVSY